MSFYLEKWRTDNEIKIELKNLASITITGKGINHKCLFCGENTQVEIKFEWLCSGNYSRIRVYKHHLTTLGAHILNCVEHISDTGRDCFETKMSPQSGVRIDKYKDFGNELWRITFGNLNDHRKTQRLKGMKSLRELVIIAEMLFAMTRNIKENFGDERELYQI